MSIKVKGFLKDVGGASRVTKLREDNFAAGSPIPDPKDPIREMADKLHPEHMTFKVVDIREASPTSRIFRFPPPPASSALRARTATSPCSRAASTSTSV